MEKYYHAIDWSDAAHVQKFIAVAESVLADLDARQIAYAESTPYVEAERGKLLSALESDGWTIVSGKLVSASGLTHLGEISTAVAHLDAPELHRQLERMRASVDTDPGLTLGTAKELVETACKTILDERGRAFDSEWDVGRLVKEAREALSLLPSDIPDEAKGAAAMKKVVSSLGSLAQGLAELRNLYGTGHGRSGKRKGIQARHARLASGSAAALATFLLETHWEKAK